MGAGSIDPVAPVNQVIVILAQGLNFLIDYRCTPNFLLTQRFFYSVGYSRVLKLILPVFGISKHLTATGHINFKVSTFLFACSRIICRIFSFKEGLYCLTFL